MIKLSLRSDIREGQKKTKELLFNIQKENKTYKLVSMKPYGCIAVLVVTIEAQNVVLVAS